jgi:hypothetical protein
MPEAIVCPSGLAGTLRGLKVREENLLASRKEARRGAFDKILSACWTGTADSGPYSLAEGKVDWSQVLQGDRFYALVQLRRLSYGDAYAFSVPCKGCGERIDWELSLAELSVRPLSAPSRRAFEAGNRFEATLPGAGKKVWFKLFTGADESRFSAMRRENASTLSTAILLARIVEIEGVKDVERRRFVEDLEAPDADFLRGEFDRVDCGVETTIEIECPECYRRQEVDLPFDQGFFMPSMTKRPARARTPSSPA